MSFWRSGQLTHPRANSCINSHRVPPIDTPLTPAPFTVLLVAATEFEFGDLSKRLAEPPPTAHGHAPGVAFEFLVTGVGPVATAAVLAERLVGGGVQLVINVGLAGALDLDLEMGGLYDVTTDHFGDLGAEDADGSHLTVFDLGLADANAPPFEGGLLRSLSIAGVDPASGHARALQTYLDVARRFFSSARDRVTAVTLSRAHGSTASIRLFRASNAAEIESMEGAAVFYCAARRGVPCVQYRSVSNYVERRNREAWDIPGALRDLTSGVGLILEEFRRTIRDAPAAPPPRGR